MTKENDEEIGTVVKSILLRMPLDTYSHLKRVQGNRISAEAHLQNPSLHALILEAVLKLK